MTFLSIYRLYIPEHAGYSKRNVDPVVSGTLGGRQGFGKICRLTHLSPVEQLDADSKSPPFMTSWLFEAQRRSSREWDIGAGNKGDPVGRGRRRCRAPKEQTKKDPRTGSIFKSPIRGYASAGTWSTHLSPRLD